MIRRKMPNHHRSQGAVLLVALVLLLALTLIGVSAIDSSSMQAQMATNSLYARNLYQCSLSEIQAQRTKMKNITLLERIVKSTTNYVAGFNDGGITYAGPGLALDPDTNNCNNSPTGYLAFAGEGPPPSGYSIKIYKGMNYEINAVTTISGTDAKSNQTQGLKRPAPKDQQ